MPLAVVRKKLFVVAAMLWMCASASAQTISVADDRSFSIAAGETQSTVVAPGHPDCAAGRILVSHDGVRPPSTEGIVVYRDLNEAPAEMHKSKFDVMPNAAEYQFGTNDHDLVSLANGDVYYLSGAFSRTAVSPEPSWWKSAYRWSFGPGARSVLLVWRSTDCGKTFQYQPQMEFDPAVQGNRNCALPQRPRVFRHDATSSANLTVPFAAFSNSGEEEWRWCFKCQQLFSSKSGQANVCPAGDEHAEDGSYELLQNAIPDHPDETGFRRCKLCGTLFDSKHTSACPTRTTHTAGATEYFLIHGANAVAGAEQGWRWCGKCQTLYRESASPSVCPMGARHDGSTSLQYQIPLDGTAQFAGEQGWRRCTKCQQLFRNKQGVTQVCPTGGAHNAAATAYQLLTSKPANVDSQAEWRLCTKCGSMHINSSKSQCPSVGAHDGSGSPDYHLAHEEGTGSLQNLQTNWRRCDKCSSVYFNGDPSQVCPARGKPNEQPFFDMGGSDGQLIKVDRATNRFYLTFQCVGFTEELGQPHFELSTKGVNRTLVAVSKNGAKWFLLGGPNVRGWRMGLLPLGDDRILLATSSLLIPAKSGKNFRWSFNAAAIDVAPNQAGWEGFDGKKAPRDLIRTYMWAHTVIARTPGSKRALMVMPDTIAGKGHGYRLFFVDSVTKAVTEAKVPITPSSGNADDFTFHLQAIDHGQGPVLLYWNDVSGTDVTIRGRLVMGLDSYTNDFDISKANGVTRSFSLAQVTDDYWYGDYQTAGAHKTSIALNSYVFYPLWVEPDKTVHYGKVTYTPLSVASAVPIGIVTAKGLNSIAKDIPLTMIKTDEQTEDYESRQRTPKRRRKP